MIRIAQMISTIQCEGPTLGTPTFLVRFGGCNLNCPFCDTKWANKNDKSASPEITDGFYPKAFEDNRRNIKTLSNYIMNNMPHSKHIMFTGGEPLIYYEAIIDICNNISDEVGGITVEIETNGMLISSKMRRRFLTKLSKFVNVSFNISPKLDTSCHKGKTLEEIFEIYSLIINEEAIDFVLKFIYGEDKIDLIKKLCEFSDQDCYIMPLTHFNREEEFVFEEEYERYRKACLETIEFCKQNKGFIFTPREHLFLFNNKDESK